MTLTFLGLGGGSVTITPSIGTVTAAVLCGGTGLSAPSQTITTTCVSSNLSISDNTAVVTFLATSASGSAFSGWSGASGNLTPTTCSGATNPCTGQLATSPAALTVNFAKYYFSNVSPTGAWNISGNWQTCSDTTGTTGCIAAAAPPTPANSDLIVVRSGDEIHVTSAVSADQLLVATGGTLTVDASQILSPANGLATDLTVDGTLTVDGIVAMGSSVSTSVSSTGTLNVNSTGALTGAGGSGSTRSVLVVASAATSTIAGAVSGSLFQIDLTGSVSVTGNISVTGNSVITVTGTVNVSSTGNINMGGGTGSTYLINSGGVVDYASGSTNTHTGGSAGANPTTVASGGTLRLRGTSVISSGTGGPVTIASGANLEIGSTAGISSSGATGNIQVSGTRTFSTGANYSYIGTAAQITGNGLPGTVNNLTVSNTGGAVTPTSNLRTDGTLSVLSGATLSKSGTWTLTVGAGGVSNAGTIALDGGPAGCAASVDTNSILLQSSAPGTQRAWSGAGTFTLADVDVQDQAGSASIVALSSTNSGNNGANWTFLAGCVATHTVTFDANGGSGTMAPQTSTANVAANLTANAFTRTGYTFTGWNTVALGARHGLRRRGQLSLHDQRHPVRPVVDPAAHRHLRRQRRDGLDERPDP